MNDLMKNPIAVFIAGLLALWLIFKVLKIFIGFFWLIVMAFVVLFVVNSRFRNIVQSFFRNVFRD